MRPQVLLRRPGRRRRPGSSSAPRPQPRHDAVLRQVRHLHQVFPAAVQMHGRLRPVASRHARTAPSPPSAAATASSARISSPTCNTRCTKAA
ncbi:hypothetical protein ZWY2020_017007 [Hordeum vulgare]|nr:hypothetical protein ZWY2020_017007 [Hordeum vulgare]